MSTTCKMAETIASPPHKATGKFKSVIMMIRMILRAFKVPQKQTGNCLVHSTIPNQLSPSHGLHISRRPPNLQQLALQDGRQKVNERIQQRLQGQRNSPFSEDTSPHNNSHKLMDLSKDVKEILVNSPWNRRGRDIELVRKELQKSTAFQDYPPFLQKTLSKVCWYQFLEDGRTVIKKGHCTSSFHIILSGKVIVSSGGVEDDETILTAGDTFGEAELLINGRRMSTYTVSEYAELLVISKSDYLDLGLRQARNSYQKAKPYEFVRSINLLKHWPLSNLESQPDVCKLFYSRPNNVVVKDSKKSDWIYIVISGTCRVVKRFVDTNMASRRSSLLTLPTDVQQRKLSVLGQLPDSPLLNERTVPQRIKGMKHSHTTGSLQATERTGSQLHPGPTLPAARKQFLVQLEILQPKDIFGLSSIIHESEPSVTLMSNGAELVVISKAFILQHLSESIKMKLKRQVMEYPSEEAMRKRIRDHYTWNIFKQATTNQTKRRI